MFDRRFLAEEGRTVVSNVVKWKEWERPTSLTRVKLLKSILVLRLPRPREHLPNRFHKTVPRKDQTRSDPFIAHFQAGEEERGCREDGDEC